MTPQWNIVVNVWYPFIFIWLLIIMITYFNHKTLLFHGLLLAIYNFIFWVVGFWAISWLLLFAFDAGFVLSAEYISKSYTKVFILLVMILALFLYFFHRAKKTWVFLWFEGNFFEIFCDILNTNNIPYLEDWKNNTKATKTLFLANLNETITITKRIHYTQCVHNQCINDKLFHEFYENLKEKSSFSVKPLKRKIIVFFVFSLFITASLFLLIIQLTIF